MSSGLGGVRRCREGIGSYIAALARIPPPTLVVWSRQFGLFLCYYLEHPVWLGPGARQRPRSRVGRVSEAVARRCMGAEVELSRGVVPTPGNGQCRVVEFRRELYKLADLLPLAAGMKLPALERLTGAGFAELLQRWAYAEAVRMGLPGSKRTLAFPFRERVALRAGCGRAAALWLGHVRMLACELGASDHVSPGIVAGIAHDSAEYGRGKSEAQLELGFSEVQAERPRARGGALAAAVAERTGDRMTVAQFAADLGVHRDTLRERWLRGTFDQRVGKS